MTNPSNFERMMQLAEDVFSVRTDPDQLNVDDKVIEQLIRLHPATMSEKIDGNGPVAWVLIIPTTRDLMYQFLQKKITEKQLFELTPLDIRYDALYLCSALVLQEFRDRGIAKQLTLSAIENIRRDHPVKTLFVWPFSREGASLAEKVALLTELPLKKREI